MLDDGVQLKRDTSTPAPQGGGIPPLPAERPCKDHDDGLLPMGAWNISKLALMTIIGGMIGLMAAITWMRHTTPAFTATMVVGPTAQLGLAGMGFRVPTINPSLSNNPSELHADERVSDFEHFRRLLTSARIAAPLGHDETFMRQLFHDRWDVDRREWKQLESQHRLTHWLRGTVLPASVNAAPSALRTDRSQSDEFTAVHGRDGQFIADWLKQKLLVRQVGETAMYAVTFRHEDRQVAVRLLTMLFERTDRALRQEAKRRIDIQVEYLSRQMQRTDLASHRQAMSDLLARELQTSLMLGVDLPFAADMIEPPQAPMTADWPAPLPIAGVALLAGLLFGFAIGFAWVDRQRRAVA